MCSTFYRENHTGADRYAAKPLPFTETALNEVEEKDREARVESEEWAWKVHEVALHEASQREGLPVFSSKEPLLKKVSEEVTRKAQEKLNQDRKNEKV